MTPQPVLVQKFGGTSVATAERREQVVEHVRRARADGYQVAIVVSAMGRRGDPYATDTLLDLLRADGSRVDDRDYDLMFTCGEAISVALMAHTLKRAGIPAVGLTSIQAGIHTDGRHVEAEIVEIDTRRMRSLLAAGEVPVVTGGQGAAKDSGDYTTLGRGGSDTSGVAVGVALGAEKVDIFTDVEGVAVTDPRIVPAARLLRQVSYEAMYEMARFGAKVVHPRALRTGWHAGMPVVVRSTFSTAPGTLVSAVPDERPIVGIAILTPMHTVALPRDAVSSDTRVLWEQRRLILTIVDNETGRLLAGAPPDKSEELNAAIAESGSRSAERLGDRCWVSLVGDTVSLRERQAYDRSLLGRQGCDISGYECAERRATFVVATGDKERAVHTLYDDLFA